MQTDPLDNPDLLQLVLQNTGVKFDRDASQASPDRERLRCLHTVARDLVDGMCTAYRDTRRAGEDVLKIDPAEVASRAATAMQVSPLKRLTLEGLDDDALATVIAAASAHLRSTLEVLWLQRGLFAGTCLYTADPRLPCMLDGGGASPKLLPRLTELDLGGCGQLTDAGLEALTAAAPLLARLRITVNARLKKPRLSCPWLRSATLAICANLTDDAVGALCFGSPLLRELSLWRCASLRAPLLRGSHLSSLNLCECVELVDAALTLLRAHCPALASLHLAGCDALATSTPHWGGGPSLTALDVSDMPASTNDAKLTAACAASPRLKRLDMSRAGPSVQVPRVGGDALTTIVATRCEHLLDDAVTHACSASPHLSSLMLALCTSLVAPMMHGEHLAEVNLSGCQGLRDDAVTHLCTWSPNLSRLMLSLCASLVAPHAGGPRLRRLDLSHSELLRLPTVGGPSLEELSMSNCRQLEDEALEGACAISPRLRKLSINGCSGLKTCRLSSPSLQVLHCLNVERHVVDVAADRLQCPSLHKIVCETESHFTDEGFEEVN